MNVFEKNNLFFSIKIRYGVREYAVTAIDMIARRLRLAFLNVQAAQEALPTIVNIMADELNWNKEEKDVIFFTKSCTFQ